jgi:hypothetical protein
VTKKKLYGILILAAVGVTVAGGLYVAFNVKTIKITSDLSCRVTFGKMSTGEAERVLAVAEDKLMPARKYAFARDAYRAVVDYHRGELCDDAFLGMARTYLAEGKRAEAYPWLARVVEECPRGSVVEEHKLDAAVGRELEATLARPPLDYDWAIKYLGLLNDAESPDAAAWRRKFKDIIETPFDLSAVYTHEKELAYVVRETASRDARATALFYAREDIPAKLVEALKKRVRFGGAVPDEKVAAFVEERVVYVDKLEAVKKTGLDEQAKVRHDKRREELGLGELPAEWAEAFLAVDEDTGWVAAASVVGQVDDVTIAEVLTYGGVSPLTGETSQDEREKAQ